MIAATQIRVGILILYNGKPYRVSQMVHRTPGNLRGFVQAKLVNIENGSNQEIRFTSEDKVERAMLDEHTLQFSYKAGDEFHFMNTESYEMIALVRERARRQRRLPDRGHADHRHLLGGPRRRHRAADVRGADGHRDDARTSRAPRCRTPSKPAILETGLEIKVPPYIEQGNRVKIDTRTGEFVERL